VLVNPFHVGHETVVPGRLLQFLLGEGTEHEDGVLVRLLPEVGGKTDEQLDGLPVPRVPQVHRDFLEGPKLLRQVRVNMEFPDFHAVILFP
jgi:hypothetical protein